MELSLSMTGVSAVCDVFFSEGKENNFWHTKFLIIQPQSNVAQIKMVYLCVCLYEIALSEFIAKPIMKF